MTRPRPSWSRPLIRSGREIARLTLERLIADGRIHPARIEEMVEKVKKEIDEVTYQAGIDAAYEVGITDMHPDLLRILGRLRYRTSYTQNVLRHSVEAAILCGIMAAELGSISVSPSVPACCMISARRWITSWRARTSRSGSIY